MPIDWTRPYGASQRLALVDRVTGLETPCGDVLVRGGTLTRDDGTQCKESASVTVVGDFDPDPMLVRLYADFKQGEDTQSVALGTFVASIDSDSYDGAAHMLSVALDGRLTELAQDGFEAPFTVEAGTPAVAYAQSIAEQAGFAVVADPSTFCLSQVRSYGLDEDQSKLDVVNDLLDLAGFSAARCDPMGNLLMRRYVEPGERQVSATYSQGPGSTMHREVTDEADGSEVANVVLAVYSTQDATVVGTAVDDSPASRWSTVARGRRIVKRYRYTELVTQAEADAKAAELLATAQSVVRHVRQSVAFRPDVTIGDSVALDYPDAGVSGTFAVRSQSIALDGAMQVQTDFRAYVRR